MSYSATCWNCGGTSWFSNSNQLEKYLKTQGTRCGKCQGLSEAAVGGGQHVSPKKVNAVSVLSTEAQKTSYSSTCWNCGNTSWFKDDSQLQYYLRTKGANCSNCAESSLTQAAAVHPPIPPKPGVFGSTAVPTTTTTTTEELLALIKTDSQLSSKAGQIASWIKRQDWEHVTDILSSSVLSNSELVSSLLKNVLGPISEAQGIAKAVIGIAAAIIDM
jgi:hypothetical protein